MSTLPWFTGAANKDNTGNSETHDYQAPAYIATLPFTPKARKTVVNVGQLTGAMTVNAVLPSAAADDNAPFVGDTVDFLFSADSAGAHIVTFGTGFKTSGTLSVAASKFGRATFMFDGHEYVGSVVASA